MLPSLVVPVQAQTQGNVWTDKSTYTVGETVTITMAYTQMYGVLYWVIVLKPDGSSFKLSFAQFSSTVTTTADQTGGWRVKLWSRLVVPNSTAVLRGTCTFTVTSPCGIASGQVSVPDGGTNLGYVLKYCVSGSSTVKKGQLAEYTILLQLFQGDLLSELWWIRSGTINLAVDRRNGPDVYIVRYERYKFNSGWQQVELARDMQLQHINDLSIDQAISVIPVVGTAYSFIQYLLGLFGITLYTPPTPPSPTFTDRNAYYISQFPIVGTDTTNGITADRVDQYRFVFDLNPAKAGSNQVHLWTWVRISNPDGTYQAIVNFSIDFVIQVKS